MISRLKQIQRLFKQNFDLYQGLYRDPRTPRLARWLLWAAIGYALLPFDLIPDFIPVVGHLDDIVIIPLLILGAVKLIPRDLYEEHRHCVFGQAPDLTGLKSAPPPP